jgi:hypothetical protein
MQNSRFLTIEGRLKVKILSGVIMLLLVGLHPVRVFADAGSSPSDSTATVTTADPDSTTTDTTPTDPSQDTTTSAPTDTSDSTSTSSPDTQQSTPTDTTDDDAASSPVDSSAVTPSTAPSDTDNTQTDGTSATISNQGTSTATSGDATVTHSSTAGNATSGNAQTIATALNILSSSTDVQSSNVDTSVTNISGNNNNQNVVIDPSTSGADPESTDTTEVNTASSGTIDNNLTLGATTGDATVSGNRSGGNATTGDATVDANLVNITNSDLNSGQYYIGVINIYGDLSSNILLSPEFVSQLLAENPSLLSGDTSATNNVNQTINNEINTNALSGDATVENNWDGGNATSGNATTSVDTYDLANSDITGNNALLVFINVLGTWEGVIIGAPVGATTAVFGDSSAGDNVAAAPATDSQATLVSATNEEIDNTINATATTGNATVAYNGRGGNATSGNAAVSVNLLNILNSDVSLSGWFGVLFINVFGNWSGDLGIVTPPSASVTVATTAITTDATDDIHSLGSSIANDAYTFFEQSTSSPTIANGQVLGTTTSANTNIPNSTLPSRTVASTAHDSRTWWLPALAGMILAVASLSLERVLRIRKQNS